MSISPSEIPCKCRKYMKLSLIKLKELRRIIGSNALSSSSYFLFPATNVLLVRTRTLQRPLGVYVVVYTEFPDLAAEFTPRALRSLDRGLKTGKSDNKRASIQNRKTEEKNLDASKSTAGSEIRMKIMAMHENHLNYWCYVIKGII